MFGRKRKAPDVELTAEAYQRWLRACRPQPLPWFLGLSAVEQQALADLGDEYTTDVCLGIGWAVHDPQAASTGVAVEGGDQDAEAQMLAKVAAAALERLRRGPTSPVAAPQPRAVASMGGTMERREGAKQGRQDMKDARRTFLGRKPDGVEA